jgi:hypothetical protein
MLLQSSGKRERQDERMSSGDGGGDWDGELEDDEVER